MSSTIIFNVAVWKWHADAAIPIHGSNVGSAVPNCYVCTRNGYVTKVSNSNEETPSLEDFDVVIDGKGRLLLPGLMDSHIHVGLLGESQYFVDLSGCYSMEELRVKVGDHIAKYADLSWIIGINWDQTKLGSYPTRGDIDSIATDKPIFLWRACWHIGLANTTALTFANIVGEAGAERAKAPPGGVIEMDSEGIPTGIMKERATELIVAAQQKQPAGDSSALVQKMRFLTDGMAMCAKVGLTTVQTNDEGALRAYQLLQQQKRLPLRVFLTPIQDEIYQPPTETRGIQGILPFRPGCLVNVRDMNSALSYHNAFDMHSRLLLERVKIFSDGSLGAETAALRSFPAADTTSSTVQGETKKTDKGVLVHDKSALSQMLADAYSAGFRVEVHAIGDAAAELVLSSLEDSEMHIQGTEVPESFEGLISADRQRHYRPLLTHCQVLGPDLIERMAQLGVVANIQPPFVPTDMKWVRARLGAQQLQYSYAWKTLLMHSSTAAAEDSNILVVAGGSDSPIEHPNPFTGIYDAIFRTNKHRLQSGEEEEIVFQPHECLTFSQALWTYTIGGAYAAVVENKLGRIEEGYIADLVLVDPAILSHPELLHGLLPYAVLVGGVLTAANNLRAGEEDHAPAGEDFDGACPVLLKGPGPALWKGGGDRDALTALSEATYMPGRNGHASSSGVSGARNQVTSPPVQVCVSEYCPPVGVTMTGGLRCACILRGKYCSDSI